MSVVVGVVFTGDSLTFPSFSHAYQWAGMPAADVYDESSSPRTGLRAFPSPGVIFANYALSGWRIQDLEAQAPSLNSLICTGCPSGNGRPRREYVLVVGIGTNPTHNDPTAQAARTRDYCLSQQAEGWRVVVIPPPSRCDGIIANFDTVYRIPLNTAMSGWGLADGVRGVVSTADSQVYGLNAAQSANDVWNADQVHLTIAGHERQKNAVAAVLNPLITSLQA